MDIPVVIYDTSSLILNFKDRIPVLQQVRNIVGLHIPVVVEHTLHELEQIEKQREYSTRVVVRHVINLIRRTFSVASCHATRTDDAIVELARRLTGTYRLYVVTCDMELKRKLEKLGVKVIYFRKAVRGMVIDEE